MHRVWRTGNVIAITQQSLWGRALDYAAVGGGRAVSYPAVIRDSLKAEGFSAFFTPSKWFTRVLMNAPIQGTVRAAGSHTHRAARGGSARLYFLPAR